MVLLLWQGETLAQDLEISTISPQLWPQALGERSGNAAQPGSFRDKLLLDLDAQNATAAKPRESRLRPRLYWSMGLALAAGGAAWWSGHRADRAYDRYLHSAGRQHQDEQFRRAERYDRLAGGAFVFMEAGIVLTTYLVFF